MFPLISTTLELLFFMTLIQSSHCWLLDRNTTTPSSTFTTDSFMGSLTFSLNWLTIPFFMFIMVLAIGCWYRRYRLRQHYLEQQRLSNPAVVHYNSAMNAPPSNNASSTLPVSAYPRQEVAPYAYPPMPAQMVTCPPYQEQVPPVTDTTGPPSYEEAIKPPADGQQ